MTEKYRVGIIGAGRIGSSFDAPDSEHVLTHAHAFSRNPKCELAGIMDVDFEHGKKEAKKWETEFFPDIESLFSSTKPDIVVIATPDDTHAELLLTVADKGARLIICEKPVSASRDQSEQLRGFHGVPVIVNFRRRFDDDVQSLAEDIKSGTYGAVISATAIYSKGTLHNGSHIIDLARFLFGELKTGVPLSRIQDWDGEPTVSAFISFERCPRFYLTTGDERAYSVFELDILTEKKRFHFSDEGMTLSTQEVIDDPLYKGFRILGESTVQKTNLIHAMENIAEHAVRVLDGSEESRATLENALKTQDACFRLLE